MTKECKQGFTLRITQANKTEMIVILYEMILTYLSDAEESLSQDETMDFRAALRKARGCFGELLASLNLEYDLAARLLSLYLYCNREITKADIHKDAVPLQNIRSVVEKLHAAYKELALMDTTGPVMQNSQAVYTGLTYGKNKLSEDMTEESLNRGFLA